MLNSLPGRRDAQRGMPLSITYGEAFDIAIRTGCREKHVGRGVEAYPRFSRESRCGRLRWPGVG